MVGWHAETATPGPLNVSRALHPSANPCAVAQSAHTACSARRRCLRTNPQEPAELVGPGRAPQRCRCNVPTNTTLAEGTGLEAALAQMAAAGLRFPVLAKPLWADGREGSHALAGVARRDWRERRWAALGEGAWGRPAALSSVAVLPAWSGSRVPCMRHQRANVLAGPAENAGPVPPAAPPQWCTRRGGWGAWWRGRRPTCRCR